MPRLQYQCTGCRVDTGHTLTLTCLRNDRLDMVLHLRPPRDKSAQQRRAYKQTQQPVQMRPQGKLLGVKLQKDSCVPQGIQGSLSCVRTGRSARQHSLPHCCAQFLGIGALQSTLHKLFSQKFQRQRCRLHTVSAQTAGQHIGCPPGNQSS